MRPFNLEEAKAGKPVCTRDGKDVRIICWDWQNPSSISIIALVKEEKDGESIQKYTEDGKYYADGSVCDADLFMKPEKHEGWINIVDDGHGNRVGSCIWKRQKEAEDNRPLHCVSTIKIEWEE